MFDMLSGHLGKKDRKPGNNGIAAGSDRLQWKLEPFVHAAT